MPESVLKTVRVSMKRKERQPEARVKIGILVYAESSSGVEYVKKVRNGSSST